MASIADLFPDTLLRDMVSEGYIRTKVHPSLPLLIHNYSEKAQYERVWNEATRVCRGLIADTRSGEVVARPFPKFFNHGEPESAALDLAEEVTVTDKADGSLGILHPGSAGWEVATRGSFTSEQALHATQVWKTRYQGKFFPDGRFTYLFEIVYPGNRIVVDYGPMDDLVHLGRVDLDTGRTFGPDEAWPGPVIDTFPYRSLAEALAAEPRPNSEGLVVHFRQSDQRVKVKQEWYVQQHRLITGLTARRLWERCAVHAVFAAHPSMESRRVAQNLRMDRADVEAITSAGTGWLDEVKETAAEEFTAWVEQTVTRLHSEAREITETVDSEVAALRGNTRRDVAFKISGHAHRGLIFAALDGKPITAQAWAAVRPAHELPFHESLGDAA